MFLISWFFFLWQRGRCDYHDVFWLLFWIKTDVRVYLICFQHFPPLHQYVYSPYLPLAFTFSQAQSFDCFVGCHGNSNFSSSLLWFITNLLLKHLLLAHWRLFRLFERSSHYKRCKTHVSLHVGRLETSWVEVWLDSFQSCRRLVLFKVSYFPRAEKSSCRSANNERLLRRSILRRFFFQQPCCVSRWWVK